MRGKLLEHNWLVSNSRVRARGLVNWRPLEPQVVVSISIGMICCVSLLVIIFVLFYLTVAAVLCKLYCTTYILVPLVDILVGASCWQQRNVVFTCRTCFSLLIDFVRSALFVSKIRVALLNRVGCCNRLRIQANHLSTCQWTLLWICPSPHVAMMAFLVLLTGFHVCVDLYLSRVIFLRRRLLKCFLNTGFVGLDPLQR